MDKQRVHNTNGQLQIQIPPRTLYTVQYIMYTWLTQPRIQYIFLSKLVLPEGSLVLIGEKQEDCRDGGQGDVLEGGQGGSRCVFVGEEGKLRTGAPGHSTGEETRGEGTSKHEEKRSHVLPIIFLPSLEM